MPTPFALAIEDLARLWNTMIEESNINYYDPEVPSPGMTLHYPDYGPEHDTAIRNMTNLLVMYMGTVVGTYDQRLSDFLRQKNLV